MFCDLEQLFVIPGTIWTEEISNFTREWKVYVVRSCVAEVSCFYCSEQIYNAFIRAAV